MGKTTQSEQVYCAGKKKEKKNTAEHVAGQDAEMLSKGAGDCILAHEGRKVRERRIRHGLRVCMKPVRTTRTKQRLSSHLLEGREETQVSKVLQLCYEAPLRVHAERPQLLIGRQWLLCAQLRNQKDIQHNYQKGTRGRRQRHAAV